MSEDENPLELQLNSLLAEYMQQCDSGSLPDREAFLSRNEQLRPQLEELLGAADWIEHLAGPTFGDSSPANPGLGSSPSNAASDGLKKKAELIDDTQPHIPSFQPLSGETVHEANPDIKQLEASQPILPCQFGEYRLERVIGRGGMGVVYQGKQSNLDRPVAIKMIRSGALASEEEVQRFYAEARSAAKLQHPNIVTVYQCGEHDGHRFFSMDYVEGTDLSQMISSGPLDPRKAAEYVRDVARAIQYAHDKGILHRDLKPANVLVDEQEKVHITDFGLAKSVGHESGLTATGAALGTPSYMSPEQAAGKLGEQHQATDIYSLGAILFTIVTGRPPFKSNSVVETIMNVIHRPAPQIRNLRPEASADIETIVDVCLQKSPDRRYPSAADLADDLDRFLAGTPIQARPMSRVRRAWYWLLGVPIFGAVLDNRVVEPTDAHRWVQRGLISVAMLLIAAWILFVIPRNLYRNRMPNRVLVAAGLSGGTYDMVAKEICTALGEQNDCEAIPIPTAGSSENAERLENREVDLALLQADAIGSSAVAVVAPLYYEAVHILVRRDLNLSGLSQFQNLRVLVGPEKAGSRSIAQLVLDSAGLTFEDIVPETADWHALLKLSQDGESIELSERPDAAILVSRLGADPISSILKEDDYALMPLPAAIDIALLEPSVFHPILMKPTDYPECSLPKTGIPTVATTAFLAAQPETPAVLVQAVLKHLFAPEIVMATGIVSAERAAHWTGLVWHPAAREFFQPYRRTEPGKLISTSHAEAVETRDSDPGSLSRDQH